MGECALGSSKSEIILVIKLRAVISEQWVVEMNEPGILVLETIGKFQDFCR